MHATKLSEPGSEIPTEKAAAEPQVPPRYALAELLAQRMPATRRGREELEWLAGEPAGRELL